MRKILLFLALLSFINIKADAQYSPGMLGRSQLQAFDHYHFDDSSSVQKKWSLQKYAGISVGYSFYKGGGGSMISAPIGLQLTRQLNNNLYAFAGVSVAPTYMNFSHSFVNTDMRKYTTGNVNFYSRIEGGLMYINDQRTFSISGSISVDRSSYPQYYYNNHQPTKKNN